MIAYTSKTPGKTQQYNYFALNDQAPFNMLDGVAEPPGTFHIVDMPGLGFAKAANADRMRWIEFIGSYAARRPQLKLLVHLIDGQVERI